MPAFRRAWHRFDEDGTGALRRSQLLLFVAALPPPLGPGTVGPGAVPHTQRCRWFKRRAGGASDDNGGSRAQPPPNASIFVCEKADPARRAQLLLSQPQFAERCEFVDTLIALAALHLADNAGISVPDRFGLDAVEASLALSAIHKASRRFIRNRRSRSAGDAPTAASNCYDAPTAAPLEIINRAEGILDGLTLDIFGVESDGKGGGLASTILCCTNKRDINGNVP